MKHCLLFDSDGTLVDSEAINTEALADELRVSSIYEDNNALLARYRGWKFKAMLDDLGELHSQALDQAFEARFRARASNYFAERLEPIPNIHAALKALPHAKCVASNAPMSKLVQVLAKTGLYGYFKDKLFSAYDVDRWKPDPALFNHAAVQMDFSSSNCIVIEDSEVGVQAALNAGMKCVHYIGGGVGNDFSDSPGVLTIGNMLELPGAIEELESHR